MLVAMYVERRKFGSNCVNMQFDHYFPVWHYIRVDSTVASLKSRLIIIISVDRDMRLGVHFLNLDTAVCQLTWFRS